MNIETYAIEKERAFKKVRSKLNKLTPKQRVQLALELDISISAIELYKSGKGTNIETALMILHNGTN